MAAPDPAPLVDARGLYVSLGGLPILRIGAGPLYHMLHIPIALRTIVHRQGHYDVQAGCGVVADSVPASEYEEAINKARALLKAVELAGRGLGMSPH